jgi:hypothetical protein
MPSSDGARVGVVSLDLSLVFPSISNDVANDVSLSIAKNLDLITTEQPDGLGLNVILPPGHPTELGILAVVYAVHLYLITANAKSGQALRDYSFSKPAVLRGLATNSVDQSLLGIDLLPQHNTPSHFTEWLRKRRGYVNYWHRPLSLRISPRYGEARHRVRLDHSS